MWNKRDEDTDANYRSIPTLLSIDASGCHQLVPERQSVACTASMFAANIELYPAGSKRLE